MKRCPQCGREYDKSMMFCLDDGAELLYGPALMDEPATAILSADDLTRNTGESESKTAFLHPSGISKGSERVDKGFDKRLLVIPVLLLVLLLGGFLAYRYVVSAGSEQINSIA